MAAALTTPTAEAYQPRWLRTADVKAWLRLQAQDSSDDDLITAAAAMAEPYVERCRPEWRVVVPVVPDFAAVPVLLDWSPGQVALDLVTWLEDNPGDPEPGPGPSTYTLVLEAGLPADIGRADPVAVLLPADGGGEDALPVQDIAGAPIPGALIASAVDMGWLLTMEPDADAFTLTTIAASGESTVNYYPDAETYQGAVMYAAREYRRRNSPAGIETFGEVTSFVSRFDPDIDRALQTGSYARPVVA